MTAAPLARVLVCFDGSPHARRACQLALEIASRFKSELTITTVFPQVHGKSEPLLQSLVPITEDGKTLAHLLDDIQQHAKELGVTKVHVVSLEGDVADALVDYLERHGQDLVVVGSRGLSRGRRLLLGSVSTELVQRIPAPVLVVPLGKERPRRAEAPSTAQDLHRKADGQT